MSGKNQSAYEIIIKIQGESEVVKAVLQRIKNPITVEAIYEKLPIQDRARIYKEKEIYIQGIGINMGREKSVDIAKEGDVAYWPLGDGLCFFLDNPPEPYSEINIVGKIVANQELLTQKVKSGTTIIIDRV